MKVLMVTELFPPHAAGGGWSTYYLAKALHQEPGIDLDVLVVNQDEVKTDVPVENISVRRFPNEVAYYQLYQELKERAPEYDIIQGQHSLTVPPLAFIKDTPTIGVIRDHWPICYRTFLRDLWGNNHKTCGINCLASTALDFTWKFPYKVWNHHYRAHLTKKVDLLAARSNFVEDRLNEHGFTKTETVYNFVPPKFTENVEPKGDGDILYVGRISEEKGPQLLVEALPDILDEFPEKHVTFLGDGPLREQLENNVDEMGLSDNISFLGHVSSEEVASRMKGASVVVFTTLLYEALGRVVIEAQALGTPVVTTGMGGNSEVLTGNSKVVQPNCESIGEGILNVLGCEDIGSNGNPYTQETVVRKWQELYSRLN